MSKTTAPSRTGRSWAYFGTVLGAVTSIAANIAHSYVAPAGWSADQPWTPEIGAVLGAVFWPLALLVASEVLARKRWATDTARRAGVAAVTLVGAVAAVISYQHLHALLLHYGETSIAAAIGPLAVDGLMVISSLALVTSDALPAPVSDAVDQDEPIEDGDQVAGKPAPVAGPSRARKARPRTGGRSGRSAGERIDRARARFPEAGTAEIARRVGVSDRTVRRHLNARTDTGPDPVADQDADQDAAAA